RWHGASERRRRPRSSGRVRSPEMRPGTRRRREANEQSSSAPSAEQRGSGLQHLVGGGDYLGVHFVSALRGDQVGHFRDDVDIGLFEAALRDTSEAIGGSEAVLRRAG